MDETPSSAGGWRLSRDDSSDDETPGGDVGSVTVVAMKTEVVLKAMLVVRRRGDYQPGHLVVNGDFSLTKRKR